MQDLYERTLLEGALLASRGQGRSGQPDILGLKIIATTTRLT
ncbi:hypothetical protein CWATWH0401_2161 [Crocosphaera watsonii WH 0401]|uniref:Uncharacterized protein n=1 Tax=Crocosphaera watsonii WH 0401 TaxID=555881 RepID=T2JCE8_CROWT|nr:hypothetical protein [Crocosphaera watsonii]CCQ63518.1 hypothetical protein CWATWH0401_2161 [Crocosphaera watsonii WH 0401]